MSKDLFSLSAYGYDLPQELIAQHPAVSREDSRMMIVDRNHGTISETSFREIYDILQPGDTLTLNDTKVIPARLFGKKKTGGKIEILLMRNLKDTTWEALLKPAKKAPIGTVLEIGHNFYGEVIGEDPLGSRYIEFKFEGNFEEALNTYGQMPLPHYIVRDKSTPSDHLRYQTVYAKNPGAIAAPTAGLHFTSGLLEKLADKGIHSSYITLHVGIGTFRPVKSPDIRSHQMHTEPYFISPEAAERMNQRQKGKLHVCVGTTSCRALETSSTQEGIISPGHFETQIFIYPGYKFKHVQSLLTNFHLPHTSLLMLISAFAGYDLIQEAYAKAIEKKFRFYSYGDAMLII